MNFKEISARISEKNQHAGLFIEQILTISALWDDLIDLDRPVTETEINQAFEIMLIHLPRNLFYSSHFSELNPILISAIQNWYIANRVEKDKRNELYPISFIIRSSYVDLITMTAYIVGGTPFAQEIGTYSRVFAHDEGLPGYTESLNKQEVY
jgi:hypothetical protein